VCPPLQVVGRAPTTRQARRGQGHPFREQGRPRRVAPVVSPVRRGHALIRKLRGGFSSLTEAVAPNLRLATAWPRLTQAI